MKHRNFTLVELLVVIAVIGILAGLAVPVVGNAMEKGKRSKAQSQIFGIKTAILAFEQDYNKLPFAYQASTTPPQNATVIGMSSDNTGNTSKDANCFNQNGAANDTYQDFFNTLTNIKCHPTTKGKVEVPADSLNKKGKRYLDVTSKYIGDDDAYNGIRDPWGRPYIILLDTDYNDQISDSRLLGDTTLIQKAAIISVGPKKGTLSKEQIKEEIRKKKAVISWE